MILLERIALTILFISLILLSAPLTAAESLNIPILVYHNFNPDKPGSMNLKPSVVEEQFKWLKDNGYTVIPLKDAVAYLQGKKDSLPAKSVVITADDGWESDYKYFYPIVKKFNYPVTLFIYPETISAGKNALTWEQLKELQQTGLFDIQDHTYDHPNFKHSKKQKSAEAYAKYVKFELQNSKKVLEEKMNIKISYLAWPFGIYDAYLEQAAAEAGFDMAFTIDARTANRNYRPMAQPRFMIVESQNMNTFAGIVKGANKKTEIKN